MDPDKLEADVRRMMAHHHALLYIPGQHKTRAELRERIDMLLDAWNETQT